MLDFLKTHLGQCNQTDVRHDKFYFDFILLLRVCNQVDVSCDKYLIINFFTCKDHKFNGNGLHLDI